MPTSSDRLVIRCYPAYKMLLPFAVRHGRTRYSGMQLEDPWTPLPAKTTKPSRSRARHRRLPRSRRGIAACPHLKIAETRSPLPILATPADQVDPRSNALILIRKLAQMFSKSPQGNRAFSAGEIKPFARRSYHPCRPRYPPASLFITCAPQTKAVFAPSLPFRSHPRRREPGWQDPRGPFWSYPAQFMAPGGNPIPGSITRLRKAREGFPSLRPSLGRNRG